LNHKSKIYYVQSHQNRFDMPNNRTMHHVKIYAFKCLSKLFLVKINLVIQNELCNSNEYEIWWTTRRCR